MQLDTLQAATTLLQVTAVAPLLVVGALCFCGLFMLALKALVSTPVHVHIAANGSIKLLGKAG